jgi:alpha-methylacyl-CoA racemase
VPPLNLVGDFGGGSMYLVIGMLAALLEASKAPARARSSMPPCATARHRLITFFFDMTALGRWTESRKSNMLDGGAHFYGVYECSCGNFVSIGSIEPQFYALLRELAGLSEACYDNHMDRRLGPR